MDERCDELLPARFKSAGSKIIRQCNVMGINKLNNNIGNYVYFIWLVYQLLV